MEPSRNGNNGRDSSGRFAKGNAGGPGNPHARQVADIRRTLLSAVTDDDLIAIAEVLVQRARGGDVQAAKEILDRMLGKPKATMVVEADSENVVFGPVRFRGGRSVTVAQLTSDENDAPAE